MSEDLQSLPPDIAALLQRTRGHSGPSPAMKEELRSRLAPVLAPRPLPSPSPAPQPPKIRSMGPTLATRLPVVVLAFGLGSGVTAWHYAHRPPEVRIVTVTVPAPAEPSGPLAPLAAPAVPAAAAPTRHRSASRPAAAPGPAPVPTPTQTQLPEGRDGMLALERTLLERGRTALTRGDASGALRAADEHAQRFPDGELIEEREALRIQALVAEGKVGEATKALGQFHERFPKSLIFQALRREFAPAP